MVLGVPVLKHLRVNWLLQTSLVAVIGIIKMSWNLWPETQKNKVYLIARTKY